MILKRSLNLFLGMFLVIMSTSCSKNGNSKENIIYFNSFENTQDLVGYEGYCSLQILDESVQDGGEHSVSVSCGCIVPHATLEIGPFDEDYKLIISAWSKGYGTSGSIILENDLDNISMSISRDGTWSYYESKDVLNYKAGEKLYLSLYGGGKLYGEINVDLLKVIAVD